MKTTQELLPLQRPFSLATRAQNETAPTGAPLLANILATPLCHVVRRQSSLFTYEVTRTAYV